MILPLATSVVIYLAPILLLAVYKIGRLNRSIAQAANSQLPFQLTPVEAGPTLLRRSTAPDRIYLVQQLKLAVAFYLLMSWTEFFILIMPILNPVSSATRWFDSSAYIWFIFLRNAARSEKFLGTTLFFCAVIVIAPLRAGAPAIFHRTRPIRLGVLFWARVLPFTAAMTAAMLTSILLALLVLVGLKGQVWQHLPAVIPRVIGPADADIAQAYVELLRTSPTRMFLSMITTVPLVFTSLIAIFSIPLSRWFSRGMLPRYLLVVVVIGFLAPFFLASFSDTLHAPRMFFLYDSLGSPPEYAMIVGPILLSIVFLLLGRVFFDRIET